MAQAGFLTGDVAWSAGLLAGAAVLAWAVHAVVFNLTERMADASGLLPAGVMGRLAFRPSRLIFILFAFYLAMPMLRLPRDLHYLADRGVGLGFIVAFAWALARAGDLLAEAMAARLDGATIQGRRVLTQIRVFRRIFIFLLGLVAAAALLMTFETFRQFGASLLASAGLAGIIIGFASQKTLSLLISGLQIAIAQPIRLGDQVLVEKELGVVEEITFTFVAVRLWDNRHLILPVTYFIDKPFINSTRQAPHALGLLGTVDLYLDHAAPVDELRTELGRILRASPAWDGRTEGLQVVEAGERTVTVQATIGVGDGAALWNLRCEVREKLLRYLSDRHPAALPRLRADLSGAGAGAGSLATPQEAGA